jgi:hypothetical protein
VSLRINNLSIERVSNLGDAADLYTAARMAEDWIEVSNRILRRILNGNASTEFGRRRGFDRIRNRTDFRAANPLTSYSDYRASIANMAAGEIGVLCPQAPDCFLITSGTTTEPKLVPRIRRTERAFSHHRIVQALIEAKTGPVTRLKGTTAFLMARPPPAKTTGGYSILPLSYLNFVSRYHGQMERMSSPSAVFDLSHHRTALDLHLLFAIRSENLNNVSATFLPVLLDQFFHRIDQIGEAVCEAISRGQVDIIAATLEQTTRNELNQALGGPAGSRAERIKTALSNPDTFAGNVWPDLRYVRCLSSATFAVGRRRLQERIGALPIFSPVFSSSEAFLGFSLNPEDDPPQYALVTEDAFVEFQPDSDEDSADTVFCDQLEVGCVYRLIITTYEGLCRYRLGDRVKVTGFWGSAPVVELLGRVGLGLNAFGEKTPEDALANAVRDVAENTGIDLHEFAAALDWSPARYVIYVGAASRVPTPASVLSRALDQALQRRNPDYEDFRMDGSLAESRLEFVGMEALRTVAFGSLDSLQKKGRRIISDEAAIASLKAAGKTWE